MTNPIADPLVEVPDSHPEARLVDTDPNPEGVASVPLNPASRPHALNARNPCGASRGAVCWACGCAGVTVDALMGVGPALQAAVQAQAAGKCTVIEMMLTQELGDPFRRDALSKPVRYLEKYQAYT